MVSWIGKLIGKLNLSIISKGNKKFVSNQKGSLSPVLQGENGTVNIQNIILNGEVSKEDVEILTRSTDLNLQETQRRFLVEQATKQDNLNTIVKKSSLEEIDDPKKLEQDWFLRWMDVSKGVSREEIQDVLAKILSGEMQRPKSYSLRTLEVVRNLTREELKAFKGFVDLSCDKGFFHLSDDYNIDADIMKKYDLSFDDFIHLAEIDLFCQQTNLSLVFRTKGKDPEVIKIGSIRLSVATNDFDSLPVALIKFTDIGSEIFSLLSNQSKSPKESEYIADFIEHLEKKGFSVKKSIDDKPKLTSNKA